MDKRSLEAFYERKAKLDAEYEANVSALKAKQVIERLKANYENNGRKAVSLNV